MASSGSGPVPEVHPGSGGGDGDDGDTPMADSPSAAGQPPGTPIVVQVHPRGCSTSECSIHAAAFTPKIPDRPCIGLLH